MRNRRIKRQDKFLQVLQQIEAFHNTSLHDLAQWLISHLDAVKELSETSQKRFDVVTRISSVIDKFPSTINRRFLVDAYLLQDVRDSWGLKSSNNVIMLPTYATIWGYRDHELHPNKFLGFVYIDDDIENMYPDLLEYTWLIHELGHYLIRFEGKPLQDNYTMTFNREVSQYKLRASADKGDAKAIAHKKLNAFSQYWNWKSQWPREIMIDAIALWCCGPSYIATYVDRHSNLAPFEMTHQHPPVELRSRALIFAGEKLGWGDYLTELIELWTGWDHERLSNSEKHSLYNSAYHLGLMNAAVEHAINLCKELQLPRFTNSNLTKLKQAIHANSEIDEGIDLIVAAWLVHTMFGNNHYEKWVIQQIERISEEITP